MVTPLEIVFTIHTIFAALWTGGTVLLAGTVIPAARRDLLDREALSHITRHFWYLTGASVLVMLLTGGHLAGNLYGTEAARSTQSWTLVMAMVALWLILAVVLFGAYRKVTKAPSEKSAATVASAARPWFLGASVVSIALLVVAGLL